MSRLLDAFKRYAKDRLVREADPLIRLLAKYGWSGDRAVLDYQSFFGLKPDNEFGPVTERHLFLPRICDHPDNMGMAMVESVRWPKTDIKINFQGLLPGLDPEDTAEAFIEAAELWNRVSGLNLKWSHSREADIVARVGRIDGPRRVLAQSEVGQIRGRPTRQTYDSSENWVLGPAPQGEINFIQVAAHEIGHALDIGHTPNVPDQAENLMKPTYDPLILEPQGRWELSEIQRRYGQPDISPVEPRPRPEPDNDWEQDALIGIEQVIHAARLNS